MQESGYSLDIHVKQGINFPLLERSGIQSSCFSTKFQGWQMKSKVSDNSLNPKYDEMFCFPLYPSGIRSSDVLFIAVQSYKTEGKGRSLGTCSCHIPVAELKQGTRVNLTLPLKDVRGKGNGGSLVIEMKAKFRPVPEKEVKERLAKPVSASLLPNIPDIFNIRFLIHSCCNLTHFPCSPITVLRMGSSIKATQICENSQNPEFEEDIQFIVYMSQKEIAKEIVKIELLNTLRIDEAALVGEFKFVVQTAFSGEPIGWDEPAYKPNTICRAMIMKWAILTHPQEKPKNIKGFVNFSLSVLQSGQSLMTPPKIEPIVLNVMQNVMRPSEVNAQYKKLVFRIYSAEELPMMDDANANDEQEISREAFCDPIVRVTFLGEGAGTNAEYATYDPIFNVDIVFNIEIPSVASIAMIQMFDYDQSTGGLAIIATHYLPLSSICHESDDEYGFDPTFGPSMLTLYGSPRSCDEELRQQYDYLNWGNVPGITYRGRLLMEIFSKPSYSVGLFTEVVPTPPSSVKTVSRILRRKKYLLIFGLLTASRILEEFADRPIEFEISVGEYGIRDSMFTAPCNSRMPAKGSMYDSTRFYFVDYETKAVCIVPMEWEINQYRLEHLNILAKIEELFIASLHQIDDEIQKEKMPFEIVSTMKMLLKKTIEKCSISLPELPEDANELDKNFRKLRTMKLRVMVLKAKTLLKRGIEGTSKGLNDIHEIHAILKTISHEPQSQIPDLLIKMLSGDKVAYYKEPIHHFLESSVERGKDCLKLKNLHLTTMDKEKRMAGQLFGFIWFGTEQDYHEKFQFPFDGRVTAYAETYENEITANEKWGMKGLPRPSYSDANGKYALQKEYFKAPEGWQWEGPWVIEPMKSSMITEDFAVTEWTDKVYETLSYEDIDDMTLAWYSKQMEECKQKDDIVLPKGWKWSSEWTIDRSEPGDTNGWSYAVDSSSAVYSCSEKLTHEFKRRLWIRNRIRTAPPVLPNIADVVAQTGGWEYARMFSSKFDITEFSSDMVRRRRWVRYISSMDPGPVSFEIRDRIGKVVLPTPLLLNFPETLPYQVRVHIYQGRTLNSPDIRGYVTVYACVCVSNQTMKTKTVVNQLSPTWDQTLLFDNIVIVGSPSEIENTRPSCDILLYHKGPQGDVFLGQTSMTPLISAVDYQPPRMKWHPITLKDTYAGDILGIAEIFPFIAEFKTKYLPFNPPVNVDGTFQVPPGIRPIMKMTRIEILSWGLRHLKFWNARPLSAPIVEIECGGYTTTLKSIVDLKTNPNFPETSTYIDIPLPEGYTYKPPINIRLLDRRDNGFIPLVGKYVLTEFAKYDPDYLAKVLAREAAAGKSGDDDEDSLYSVSDGSVTTEASTVIVIENEQEETGCMACLSKIVKSVMSLSTVLDETDDWEFLSMYWWSRYYAMEGNTLLKKTFKHHELPAIVVYDREIELYYNNFADSIQWFKMKTVPKQIENDADEDLEKDPVVGIYKGSFRIYELPLQEPPRPLIYGDVPTSKPLRILVRVYALQAIMLACTSPIKDKYCDAYLSIQIGPKIIKDTSSLIMKTRNPKFCRTYTVETTLPNNPELIVGVFDFEATEEKKDDLIGQTKVDIEDRFLSIKRPICSLTERYMIDGPHQWRDFMLPTQILDEFCVASGIPLPGYSSEGSECVIGEERYTLSEFEKHKENFLDTKVWGKEKERIALYVLLEMGLIRDHVEKRRLFNPVLPGVPQGRLLMWCDIFPFMETPPAPMNIDYPLPVAMELRVIVYDCIGVVTEEEEPPKDANADLLHDLLSKSSFVGEKEADVSEIHTRAINGNAAFNWRFLHNFDYAYLERKVIVPSEIEDKKLDPIVTISIHDADVSISPEPYGIVQLNLANCTRGASTFDKVSMEMVQGYKKPPELVLAEEKSGEGKKKKSIKITHLSVFKKKKTLGWWPIYVKRKGFMYQTGMVSMELEVMTIKQAEKRPAGRGRGEPNSNPHIDEPIRIPTSFPVIDSKVKMIKFIWKSPNRPKMILGLIANLVGGMLAGFLLNATTLVSDVISSLTGGGAAAAA